jgi:GAF domain-containing protein
MTTLPENSSVAIDEPESALTEMESHLESVSAEHDEAKARQAELEFENANLRRELNLARDRQGATAGILKVIAGSAADVQPVFEAIVSSAAKLFEPCSATITTLEDGELHWSATAASITGFDVDRARSVYPIPFDPDRSPSARTILERRIIEIPDVTAPDTPEFTRKAAIAGGFRSIAFVPLIDQEQGIGTIIFTHPQAGFRFSEGQLAIVQTFADQAVIAIQNARLFNETREALERQTATANVLNVISRSPTDAGPVFDVIGERAEKLCNAEISVISVLDGDLIRVAGIRGISREGVELFRANFPMPLDRQTVTARTIKDGTVVHIGDVLADATYDNKGLAAQTGYRNCLGVPMHHKGEVVGAIFVARSDPGLFSDNQIRLLEIFADQAVIAIENVRLFNETKEALERQTATAEILRVIASSPSDVRPVFEAIVGSAKRLLGGFSAAVFRFIDGTAHLQAITPTNPAADEIMKNSFPRPIADFQSFAMVEAGQTVQTPDTEALSDDIREIARARRFRSMLLTPLLREGTPIGLISVTRVEPGPFSAHFVQLLQTFADQAVIAIRNVGLFKEVQARTDDLSESLRQQTAVGDVLKTISRSTFELQPVLDTLVNSAAQLCDADMAFILRRAGDEYRAGAAVGYTESYIDFLNNHPLTVNRGTVTGRAVLERHPVQIVDVAADPEYTLHETTTLAGQRTTLGVPLLRESEPIGVIVLARKRVEAFTDKQIELVATFADQAVIAIENVRLFKEVQQRTEDLSEALQQQTATADVLKLISRSAFDLQSVLDTLTESAARLCNADMGAIALRDERGFYHATNYNFSVDWIRVTDNLRLQPGRGSLIGRTLLARTAVQIEDVLADTEYQFPDMQKAAGYRSLLGVPLMRGGEPIGVLFLGRKIVESYLDKQVELVSTFADQAVIAIENVRLFDEVQAKTRDLQESLQQQTATADVLKVISRSAFDLQTVLYALLSSACRLSEADIGTVRYRDEGDFRLAATFGCKPEWVEQFAKYSSKPDRGSVFGRTIVDGHTVHIPDVLADPDFKRPEAQKLMGFRAALGVPLTREGQAFGVINLFRFAAGSFDERQIELVQTFADQAVIAIENVRLFDEVQAKTRDLSEALTYQTGSANILKVIASSPTDIDPVLQAIAESACQLCDAYDAVVRLKEGDHLRFHAHHGPLSVTLQSWPISRSWTAGRAVVDQKPVQVKDLLSAEGDEFPEAQKLGREKGQRTIMSVPLLRDGESLGAITLRRLEVNPFGDKQIALLQTFADQAVIAIGNVRMFEEVQAKTRDLSEALTYQTGSANILKVIASSPTNVGPVLKAIVESACELCEAYDCIAFLREGDYLRFSAHHGPIPVDLDKWPISRKWVTGRAFVDQRPVHVHDLMAEGDEFPDGRDMSARMGHRTMVAVPLLRDGDSIGAIILRRTEVSPFSDKQINLLQTFADQAVIAIGNVRLFEEVQAKTRDLTEALQQQTATGEVLKVIASSPTDVQPALQAIVESACTFCDAYDAGVLLKIGDDLHFNAHHGPIPTGQEPRPISREWVVGRSVVDKIPVQVPDLQAPEAAEFPEGQRQSREQGHRCTLSVPLLREGEAIGALALRRREPIAFSEKQVALLETFADQAVIAIGNVRLFEEVQARTRDLQEALTYQTGSANILKVIASSPTDIDPVLQSIVESACELCAASDAVVLLRDGDDLRFRAHHGPIEINVEKWPIGRDWAAGRAFLDQTTVHVNDVFSEPDFGSSRELSRHTGGNGVRTVLSVPLLREGESVGVLTLRRQEVNPFSDKQINLLRTFADQAVIAIGNVHLFEEVQARTRELTESLEQQTATSEVLQAISSSQGDLAPVFDAMLGKSMQLCGADFGVLNTYDGSRFHTAATYGLPPAYDEFRRRQPLDYGPGTAPARLLQGEPHVEILHLLDSEAYRRRDPNRRALVDIGGARSLLAVPLLKDKRVVGNVMIFRQEDSPFSEKQIALLKQFAAQAVIAIENARLLNELRQRTNDLSRSLDDLRTAQDRLVQTEKLASLGQLTAGIAHEIKNPLNFVNNFAALSTELTEELNDALKQAEVGEKIRAEVDELTGLLMSNLEKIAQHGRRADSIVKNMLLHSREGGGEHRPSDINALVDESLNLAYHGARAEKPGFNVTLERDFDPTAGQVDLFPQEITRVLLNLISNGFYAVTRRNKEAREPGFEPTLRASTKNLGDAVEIRIRDNGTGIPPDVREKMFNPFFTTKPAGEGTGLGLSMSHDIIAKQHGGTIDVDTEQGHFTEFRIVLPRTSNFAEKSRG